MHVYIILTGCSGDEGITGVLHQPEMEHPTNGRSARYNILYNSGHKKWNGGAEENIHFSMTATVHVNVTSVYNVYTRTIHVPYLLEY